MTVILLTGATGMLAPYARRVLDQRGQVTGVARALAPGVTETCDLSDPTAVVSLVDRVQPNLVVHLAALTSVDACENDPVAAFEANVRSTANLVDALSQQAPETRFLYVSTDQVYDAPGPNSEGNVQPRNVYALTKLWGEDHARRLANALSVRVNFFSGPGSGLVNWLVRKCQSREPARLFTDVLFNPLHANHLADVLGELIDKRAIGTVNLGASGAGLSKAAFLRAAARTLGLPVMTLQDGSVTDLSLPAYRPRDMRMNVTRAETILGHPLPSIEDGLALLRDPDSLATD